MRSWFKRPRIELFSGGVPGAWEEGLSTAAVKDRLSYSWDHQIIGCRAGRHLRLLDFTTAFPPLASTQLGFWSCCHVWSKPGGLRGSLGCGGSPWSAKTPEEGACLWSGPFSWLNLPGTVPVPQDSSFVSLSFSFSVLFFFYILEEARISGLVKD